MLTSFKVESVLNRGTECAWWNGESQQGNRNVCPSPQASTDVAIVQLSELIDDMKIRFGVQLGIC